MAHYRPPSGGSCARIVLAPLRYIYKFADRSGSRLLQVYWVCSSKVERGAHNADVAGSSPASPTIAFVKGSRWLVHLPEGYVCYPLTTVGPQYTMMSATKNSVH